MRHGLTLGELGKWFVDHYGLDVDYRVIEMEGWKPGESPGYGWPSERVWINAAQMRQISTWRAPMPAQ